MNEITAHQITGLAPFGALVAYLFPAFLPTALAAWVAALALRADPPDERRLKRARTANQLLFLAACLLHPLAEIVLNLAGLPRLHQALEIGAMGGYRRLLAPLLDLPEVTFFIVVGLAPMGFAFLVMMRLEQRIGNRLNPEAAGRPVTVGFAAGLFLYMATPTLILMAGFYGIHRGLAGAHPLLLQAAGLAYFTFVIALYAIAAPRLTGLFNTVTPLAAGPLRERLTALVDRAGVTVRDIRILRSPYGRVANAYVAGLLPNYRVIFLTETLVEKTKEEEIEGVVAHEIGHLLAGHLPIYFYFTLAYYFFVQGVIALISLLDDAAPFLTGETANLYTLPLMLGLFFLYFVLIFRVFSRAFEREADRLAAGLVGDPEPLARGLEFIYRWGRAPERVGRLKKLLLTHEALEDRLAALRAPAAPGGGASFRRKLVAPTLILVAGLGLMLYEEATVGRPRRAFDRYSDGIGDVMAGRLERAEKNLRESLALKPDDGYILGMLGNVLARTGRTAEAELCFRRSVDIMSKPRAVFQLAAFYEREGRYREALETIGKAEGLPAQSVFAQGLALLWNIAQNRQTGIERVQPALAKARDGRFINTAHVGESRLLYGLEAADWGAWLERTVPERTEAVLIRRKDGEFRLAPPGAVDPVATSREIRLIAFVDREPLFGPLSTIEVKCLIPRDVDREEFDDPLPVTIHVVPER